MSYPPAPPQGFGQNPDNLDAPLYGATIGQAASRFFKKYATFSGRASRSEYWWWTLVSAVIGAVLGGINAGTATVDPSNPMSAFGPAYWVLVVYSLATLVPSLALAVRRLHDTNRSGWWILIGLIPLIGAIVLIVFYVSAPDPAGARYDRNGAMAGGAYPGPAHA